MVFGEPVYNTNQRREILRQMKQYFDEEWLKKKAAGKLKKKKHCQIVKNEDQKEKDTIK